MNCKRLYQIVITLILISCCAAMAEPSLTIYNQNFAVVRDSIELNLKRGKNEISFADITSLLEPDSVILRDPLSKTEIQILEQNYRSDPVSQELLLSLYEGKEIDFLVSTINGDNQTVKGKIIRSGYIAPRQYNSGYSYNVNQSTQPIIEVDGQLRFSLPGQPLFPALADDTILKPTLNWLLNSNNTREFDAELSYVTGGMSWKADYSMISMDEDDTIDVIGWVTIDNQSGKIFKNARIKLMAGDVSKIQNSQDIYKSAAVLRSSRSESSAPVVTEQAFEDYHLYTLAHKTTLHNQQTKQVEFLKAEKVKTKRIYVYDGAKIDWNRYRGYSSESIRNNREYGTDCNRKVWIMKEFKNSEENNLGIPLPRGILRFYKQGDDGQLEFTGENVIDHTPKDEIVRVYTGNAFDLVGERIRTDYRIDTSHDWLDESFEIKVRNHKENEPVEIRVVENLYRWINWDIVEKSNDYIKTDSQTIEFRITLQPNEEKVITYKVHYTW